MSFLGSIVSTVTAPFEHAASAVGDLLHGDFQEALQEGKQTLTSGLGAVGTAAAFAGPQGLAVSLAANAGSAVLNKV